MRFVNGFEESQEFGHHFLNLRGCSLLTSDHRKVLLVYCGRLQTTVVAVRQFSEKLFLSGFVAFLLIQKRESVADVERRVLAGIQVYL